MPKNCILVFSGELTDFFSVYISMSLLPFQLERSERQMTIQDKIENLLIYLT
jgi:hypothetical protein